ncbi:YciI family protein [Variovorax sp. LjRoot178]|uniref:YciI family protein n=1 Tax=Variovorax sp. LjRoot178 TaxID=3342277 RepID=UPI003ECD3169
MAYVITFVDDPHTDREKKSRVRSTHVDYVTRNAERIIASGGLFPEDDDFPNGGLIILDVENRKDAVAYIENDPFFLNGIFSTYTIHRWRKFIFDHQRVPPAV